MCSLEYRSSSQFLDQVKLRFLNNDDIDTLKQLCMEWFPIKYPDAWYKEVTNNPKFFSLAAVYNDQTIGVIIAEIKSRNQCNKEDGDILGYWYPSNTKLAYILILGAAKDYRRKGVASLLLQTFLTRVQNIKYQECKAVFLHVLSTNAGALLFYERHFFKRHKHLPLYYAIQGQKMDGYSYVFYINNGEPPWDICDFIHLAHNYLGKLALCKASSFLLAKLWLLPNTILFKKRPSRIVRNL